MVTVWRRQFLAEQNEVHNQPISGRPQNTLTLDAITNICAFSHAVYRLDIVLSGFHLFCSLKQTPDGQWSTSNAEVQTWIYEFLKNLDENVYYCGVYN